MKRDTAAWVKENEERDRMGCNFGSRINNNVTAICTANIHCILWIGEK